ncbi:alpha/beta-hydrolase [Xylariomycetidae sp. FL2044]|nr:alpha/beta-hydrolase [Xylariomycetidae sp. FL2044]
MTTPPGLWLLLLSLTLSLLVTADPVVRLGSSQISYRGTTKDSIEHFQNIKFAQDTSGPRRFAPPQAYTPPDGEVDATAPGPACPQSRPGIPLFFAETPDISEDCLHLRIARPVGTGTQDKLPVVVWLHGGGVVKGSAYDPHYDPDKLVAFSASPSINKPVIYVALNYRLTIFGFARLPTLRDQNSLNVGMRDQRAGIQWVKDNIASFGGDPESITISGLSSGGTFSSLQTVAYGGTKGAPFTKVWAMSGPPGTALNLTSDATEIHTLAVAESLGCQTENDKDVLECLRELPMEKLLEVAMEYSVANHPPVGLFTFIPSIDGDFIPDRPTVLYKAGKFTKGIPMTFGWCHEDGATNAGAATSYQGEDDIKAALQGFAHALSADDYEKILSLYPASDFEEDVRNWESAKAESDPDISVHFFRASRILRDILFTCSSMDFGYEMSRQSKALDPAFPGVRLYDLNQSMLAPMFEAAGMPYIRAPHGSDTHYVFDIFLEGDITDDDQKLAQSMAAALVNFAYTGDPTPDNNEDFGRWPEAFPSTTNSLDEHPDLGPLDANILVIGGPLGTGYSPVRSDGAYNTRQATEGSQQQQLADSIEYGEMPSMSAEIRNREIQRERLLERCALVGTLAEKLGV